jgi:nucleoside-diphosphate-sugar epimerase
VKIAVTGASGFIGRHVVAELEGRGISPIVTCRPTSKIPSALAGHTVVPIELTDPPSDVFDLIGKPDIVIHLAWGGLPNFKSLHHFEQELPFQYRFLRLLIDSGLRNLLVTGTCQEYGMQSGPLIEDSEARPTTPYGFAKDALRRELEYLRQVIPFNLTWARLFYVYGEGQAASSLLPQLRTAVANGEKAFNMSGGEQLRDYLPITVLASHLVSLSLTAGNSGVVNVCSGKPISVRKLVEGWIKENGWQIVLNPGYYAYPVYEPMAFWGERTKLDRCLGNYESISQH